MKKKLFSWAVLMVLLVGLLCTTALAAPSGDAASVRSSVAVVGTGATLDGTWVDLGHGTGFFIGQKSSAPQYLVTNYHVIDTYIEFGSGELMEVDGHSLRAGIRIYFSTDDFVEGYLVDADSIKDLAVIRLATPTDKRQPLPLRSPEEGMVGDTVYTVGYPGLADNDFVASLSSWSETDATVNKGVISRLSTTSGTGVSQVQTDAVIMAGNSGGPMVDETGAVLGVNTFTVSNSEDKIYYAVNIDEVIPMLKLHSVPYEMASDGLSPVVVVLIAAVVAVLAAVLVLAKKGKLKLSGKAKKSAAPAPTADDLRFQCQSGTFAGQRFAIKGTVRIGRDPARNDLVYPADTQGISGAHCVLYIEGGKLYLKDLGSKFGTYLGQGSRLANGEAAQLQVGDKFYLGSDREGFIVTRKGGI